MKDCCYFDHFRLDSGWACQLVDAEKGSCRQYSSSWRSKTSQDFSSLLQLLRVKFTILPKRPDTVENTVSDVENTVLRIAFRLGKPRLHGSGRNRSIAQSRLLTLSPLWHMRLLSHLPRHLDTGSVMSPWTFMTSFDLCESVSGLRS